MPLPRPASADTIYTHMDRSLTRCQCWPANQSGLVTLTFDLLTLKVVSESCVTWATSLPILVFLGLSILNLGPMYARDRRQIDRRQTALLLNAPPPERGYNKHWGVQKTCC